MKKLKNLSDINNNTKEGRYLLACLSVLTTSHDITLLGKRENGTEMEPDQMLHRVYDLVEEMYSGNELPDDTEYVRPEFGEALRNLINSYSMEDGSNTPGFILAEYLFNCLEIYNKAVSARDKYFNIVFAN